LVNLGDSTWESKAYKTFEAIGSPNAKAKPTAISGSLALLLKVRRCIRIAIRSDTFIGWKRGLPKSKDPQSFSSYLHPSNVAIKKVPTDKESTDGINFPF
jgi:hypothetical protein